MGKILDRYQDDLDKIVCHKCNKLIMLADMGKKVNELMERLMEGKMLDTTDLETLTESTVNSTYCQCPDTIPNSINKWVVV
ncbi:MAG TPA: hypothetical protein EYF95_05125 [Flavobacteriales bacterium]|jgi:hypothetical protein|nr:hypothetical protein [Flavobacteriales bacterium]